MPRRTNRFGNFLKGRGKFLVILITVLLLLGYLVYTRLPKSNFGETLALSTIQRTGYIPQDFTNYYYVHVEVSSDRLAYNTNSHAEAVFSNRIYMSSIETSINNQSNILYKIPLNAFDGNNDLWFDVKYNWTPLAGIIYQASVSALNWRTFQKKINKNTGQGYVLDVTDGTPENLKPDENKGYSTMCYANCIIKKTSFENKIAEVVYPSPPLGGILYNPNRFPNVPNNVDSILLFTSAGGFLKDSGDNNVQNRDDPVYQKWVRKAITNEKAKPYGADVAYVSVWFDGGYRSYSNKIDTFHGLNRFNYSGDTNFSNTYIITPTTPASTAYANYKEFKVPYTEECGNMLYSSVGGVLKNSGEGDATSSTQDLYTNWVQKAIQIEKAKSYGGLRAKYVSVWFDGGYRSYTNAIDNSTNDEFMNVGGSNFANTYRITVTD